MKCEIHEEDVKGEGKEVEFAELHEDALAIF
jgi:hypothetical protein